MRISSVLDSIEKLFFLLKVYEIDRSPLCSTILGGEPMLGKRGLYPTVNSPQTKRMSADNVIDLREQLNLLLEIISLIDGTRTIKDIVEFLNKSYDCVVPTIESLIEQDLVRNV
jgi:aminopeptidase-like protein